MFSVFPAQGIEFAKEGGRRRACRSRLNGPAVGGAGPGRCRHQGNTRTGGGELNSGLFLPRSYGGGYRGGRPRDRCEQISDHDLIFGEIALRLAPLYPPV